MSLCHRLALVFVFVLNGIAHGAAALSIAVPAGGETFLIDTTAQVQLGKTRMRAVKIELSRDGGANFETLGTISPQKSLQLNFLVTAPAAANCVIRASGKLGKTTSFISSGL